MRTVESGIGQPNDDLLRGLGDRPEYKLATPSGGETYIVLKLYPFPRKDPKLALLIEMVDEERRKARVIGASRGSETAAEFTNGQAMTIRKRDIPRLITYGIWHRRLDRQRNG